MKKLRIGLIGAGGGISGLRGKALLAHPRVEIKVCYEPAEDRLKKVAERYPGIPIVRKAEDVLASGDVDAVIISTPNTSHFPLIERALAAGKHACVEYPMVQTLEEYDRLVSLARQKGVVLHDGLTPRIENYHLDVKSCMARIGKPLAAYYAYFLAKTGWYWREEYAGDIFVEMTIHQLEHFRNLFGEVRRVYAMMNVEAVEGGKARTIQSTFVFANGVVAVIENGWGLLSPPGLVYRVVGTEGTVEIREEPGVFRRYLRLPKGQVETADIKLDFQKTLGDDTAIFIGEILDGAPPAVPLADGRRALQLCLLAARSAATGEAMEA